MWRCEVLSREVQIHTPIHLQMCICIFIQIDTYRLTCICRLVDMSICRYIDMQACSYADMLFIQLLSPYAQASRISLTHWPDDWENTPDCAMHRQLPSIPTHRGQGVVEGYDLQKQLPSTCHTQSLHPYTLTPGTSKIQKNSPATHDFNAASQYLAHSCTSSCATPVFLLDQLG